MKQLTGSLKAAPLNTSISEVASPDRFLRIQEVADRLGVCETTVYLWIRKGIFPPSTRIGGRTSVWRESVLTAWMDHHVPRTAHEG